MNHNARNRAFLHVCPTKPQISLRMRAVWSESSLSAVGNFAFLAIQNASNEDSDQTARMSAYVRRYVSGRNGSYIFWKD